MPTATVTLRATRQSLATHAPPVLEPTVEERTEIAPLWNVILHNDDLTPMDFVVWLLISLFGHPFDDAVVLMLEVHESGAATVCACSQERAGLYVEQVHSLARARGYPLAASCERQ
jgi:ATP-dependent Clp protease adaptor protein ClpS